jgi:CheY-like chemotaxis protein
MRILIVDQYDLSRMALARLLRMQGHTVAAVASVGAGMRLCESQQFDLLLCDGLEYEDGSGYDLMRALAVACDVKGIAIDGDPSDANLAAALAAGFAEYLAKPVTFQTLQAVIAAVTGTPLDSSGDFLPDAAARPPPV